MFDFIKHQRKSKARQLELDADAPKTGGEAPDFELKDVNGENSVRLSDYQGRKPAALIFGSFT
jgi:peroxiredoxin